MPPSAKIVIAAVFSTPANHLKGLQSIYLFSEDLWLYTYDKIEHEGLLKEVFNTTATISSIKMNFLDQYLHWNNWSNYLPLSDYMPYSKEKFIQIEGTSSVLVKGAFPYFLYTIPENVLICLFLYFLYIILQKWRISRYIKSFYFIKTVLLQTLLEGNIAYFTYVCFGHLTTSFHFKYGDKLSLIFTIVFLFIVLIFSISFYPLMGHYFRKKSKLFISCHHPTNSGYLFLSIKNLMRNFLRGSVFYFLH